MNWEERLAELWAAIDDLDPETFRARMEALAAERPAGDAIAAFELASANDSTAATSPSRSTATRSPPG